MRVLIVEDEPKIADFIADVLEGEGLVPEIARDGEEGHFLGSTESYSAAILDIGLPKKDGLSVLRSWREERQRISLGAGYPGGMHKDIGASCGTGGPGERLLPVPVRQINGDKVDNARDVLRGLLDLVALKVRQDQPCALVAQHPREIVTVKVL